MSQFCGMSMTCSMTEFGIFSGDHFHEKKIIQFIKSTHEPGYMSQLPPIRQRKAIICNTNIHSKELKKLGFKEVATYKGNDGTVHVMLYIQPKCRIVKGKK